MKRFFWFLSCFVIFLSFLRVFKQMKRIDSHLVTSHAHTSPPSKTENISFFFSSALFLRIVLLILLLIIYEPIIFFRGADGTTDNLIIRRSLFICLFAFFLVRLKNLNSDAQEFPSKNMINTCLRTNKCYTCSNIPYLSIYIHIVWCCAYAILMNLFESRVTHDRKLTISDFNGICDVLPQQREREMEEHRSTTNRWNDESNCLYIYAYTRQTHKFTDHHFYFRDHFLIC